jgi:hypothetical protein
MTAMARLTAKTRAQIPKREFAVPGTDGYPIDTKGRAKAALGLVGMHGSPAEQAQVRSAVARKYPGIEQSKGPQAKKTGSKKPANGGGRTGNTTQRLARTLDNRLDQRSRR